MIKKISLLILVFLLLPIQIFADNQFPSFPMAFWGTATLNGQPLLSETKIQTFCDDLLIGETTMTENGIYGYSDSTKIKLLVSNCSGNILFKYLLSGSSTSLTGGNEIKYTDGFQSGTTINKNINFITVQSCNITNGTGSQNWNGSTWNDCTWVSCNSGYHQSGNACFVDSTGSGGGGGGGGSTTASTTITLTAIAGDANGDNKVDKYDFALIMSNWGKTGSNVCDFNSDGKVDKYDFALLMSKWEL